MRKVVVMLGAAAALAASASFAAFPDRPIKLIVPWAAGGDTDNIFRPFAPLLQKQLGQPVVIANVGGASGTKGARRRRIRLPTAIRCTPSTTTSIRRTTPASPTCSTPTSSRSA